MKKNEAEMDSETSKEAHGTVLADAVKTPMSMNGSALLQWDFNMGGGRFARYSVQMPEAVID